MRSVAMVSPAHWPPRSPLALRARTLVSLWGCSFLSSFWLVVLVDLHKFEELLHQPSSNPLSHFRQRNSFALSLLLFYPIKLDPPTIPVQSNYFPVNKNNTNKQIRARFRDVCQHSEKESKYTNS